MPDRRDAPPTDEGWFVMHDFRRLDWDAWRSATEREREHALSEAVDHLERTHAVEDAEEGGSALYSILGHKADVLLLHMRPSTADIGALERQFEGTAFAEYTERSSSFVSVTEASGYSERARDYFEGELDEDSGLANYIQTRLKPSIPDATHVCFYPMDKRRDPEQNWYDLSFEERADHMDAHGDIGRDYGGKVVQMITGAIAIDDREWGVTLWGDDIVDMKDLLYEMRFDPSTSQFAEFGSFYIGRRFPPSDLSALLAGQQVPTDGQRDEASVETTDPEGTAPDSEKAAHEGSAQTGSGDATADAGAHGDPIETSEEENLTSLLATIGLHAGENYETGDFAVVLYSTADAQTVATAVDDLRGNFEHYDSHVETVVRAHGGRTAVVSIWDSERAADTAHGFLTDLPGTTESVRGPLDGDGETTTEQHSGGEEETADKAGDKDAVDAADIRGELADFDIYAGQPHGEDIYALVLYSDADPETLQDEVDDLSTAFDRYDTHEGTNIYTDSDRAAVVSLWETQDAADTASGYLTDLPDIVGRADDGDGFSTMGMFYTVKPEHREDFVERFETVGGILAEMDGHRESGLLVNTENENDMFISSHWDDKEDAMAFFASEEFGETVDWGRDVLADKPRHVFLA
jgi:chlorite dismutase